MVNYQLSKIYKIECNITGLVYIGSTCEPTLAKRLSKHVSNYGSFLNGKQRFCSSGDIIKNGNYDIILIENYPCTSKDELHARERYWTNNINCINKVKNQGIYKAMGGKKNYDHHNDKNRRDKLKRNEQNRLSHKKYRTLNNHKQNFRKKFKRINNIILSGLDLIKKLDSHFKK